jgi:hypothetical protein
MSDSVPLWTSNPGVLIQSFEFFTTPAMTDNQAYNAVTRSIILSGITLAIFKPEFTHNAAIGIAGALLIQKMLWNAYKAKANAVVERMDPPAAEQTVSPTPATVIPEADVVPPIDQKPQAFSALLVAPTTLQPSETDPDVQFETAPMPGSVSMRAYAPHNMRPGLLHTFQGMALPAMRMMTDLKESDARNDIHGSLEDQIYACRPTGNLEYLANADMSWADGAVGQYKTIMKPYSN